MSIDPRFDGSKVRWIQGLIDPLTLTKPNPNLSTLGVESFDTWIYRHLDPSIRPLDLSTLGSTDSTLGSVDPWICRPLNPPIRPLDLSTHGYVDPWILRFDPWICRPLDPSIRLVFGFVELSTLGPIEPSIYRADPTAGLCKSASVSSKFVRICHHFFRQNLLSSTCTPGRAFN